MEFEEVFKVLDADIFAQRHRHLKDVEKFVLEGAWQGQTYDEISAASNYRYTSSYLKKGVGPRLWRLVSEVLGEEICKTSFRAALERRVQFTHTLQTPQWNLKLREELEESAQDNFTHFKSAKSVFAETVTAASAIAFSPNGELLAAGDANGAIHLWQIADGKLLSTSSRHADRVYAIAFSPDGQTLASSSGDCTVKLWDVSSRCLKVLQGHTDLVLSDNFAANETDSPVLSCSS